MTFPHRCHKEFKLNQFTLRKIYKLVVDIDVVLQARGVWLQGPKHTVTMLSNSDTTLQVGTSPWISEVRLYYNKCRKRENP